MKGITSVFAFTLLLIFVKIPLFAQNDSILLSIDTSKINKDIKSIGSLTAWNQMFIFIIIQRKINANER